MEGGSLREQDEHERSLFPVAGQGCGRSKSEILWRPIRTAATREISEKNKKITCKGKTSFLG